MKRKTKGNEPGKTIRTRSEREEWRGRIDGRGEGRGQEDNTLGNKRQMEKGMKRGKEKDMGKEIKKEWKWNGGELEWMGGKGRDKDLTTH